MKKTILRISKWCFIFLFLIYKLFTINSLKEVICIKIIIFNGQNGAQIFKNALYENGFWSPLQISVLNPEVDLIRADLSQFNCEIRITNVIYSSIKLRGTAPLRVVELETSK